MPIGTARLAHLMLPNSVLLVGLEPERSPEFARIAEDPGTWLLFPGPGSVDVKELPAQPRHLVVVDGTWDNARKLLERSPSLRRLPRVTFTPAAPSNYRIRREPAPACLSTLEAVATTLELLEAAPGRFEPLRRVFNLMVDRQLAFSQDKRRPSRHTPRDGRRAALSRLRTLYPHLLLVSATTTLAPDGAPILLQLCARRQAGGPEFRYRVRPPPGLPESAFQNFGFDIEKREVDGDLAACREAWSRWAPADAAWTTWGPACAARLRALGFTVTEHVDLRGLLAVIRPGPVGGLEARATGLGARLPEGEGRGPRKIEAMSVILRRLFDGG